MDTDCPEEGRFLSFEFGFSMMARLGSPIVRVVRHYSLTSIPRGVWYRQGFEEAVRALTLALSCLRKVQDGRNACSPVLWYGKRS